MEKNWLSFNEQHKGPIMGQMEDEEADEALLNADLPLKYTWVLWEQMVPGSDSEGANSNSYSDATKKVQAFSTVQEFWEIWNGMPQPSELLEQKRIMREQANGNQSLIDAFMIFREGVRPEWEDAQNTNGGHFQIQLKPNVGGGQIDEYWNNLVLGMVGGTIEPSNLVTGVRLVDKLSGPKAAGVIRLELWFSKYDDSQAVSALRRSMEKIMSTRLDGSQGVQIKSETKSHSNYGKH